MGRGGSTGASWGPNTSKKVEEEEKKNESLDSLGSS